MAMELKHLNPQHVMDVTGKAIDEISRLRAENAELKAKNAELKQKLEDAKATAYAESVDAGMRERRLRRALYKACANWAICEIDYWRKCLEHVGDYFDVRTGQDLDVKRCEKMIRNWINSKSKCIKNAEKYK